MKPEEENTNKKSCIMDSQVAAGQRKKLGWGDEGLTCQHLVLVANCTYVSIIDIITS